MSNEELPDEAAPPQPASPPTDGDQRRRANLARIGGGAIAGAGVSMALFSVLPIGEIIKGVPGFPTGYPIVIFGIVSLLTLVAAAFTVEIIKEQRRIVYTGMGVFALITLVGATLIFVEDYNNHPIQIVAMYTPDVSEFHDANPDTPAKLDVQYKILNRDSTFTELQGKQIKVSTGQTLAISLKDFDKYRTNYEHSLSNANDLRNQINMICLSDLRNKICEIIHSLKQGIRQPS